MVVAVSGKCCSGKNHLSALMEKDGFEIIDVDLISRDVFNNSSREIIEAFGKEILTGDEIDRLKVGKVIFSNKEKREILESIIHPKVYDVIFEHINNSNVNLAVNIPLLTDDRLINRCDAVLWISSPLFLRIFRAMRRDNYSIKTVFKRIYTQRKLSVKHLKNRVDIYNIKNSWSNRSFTKEYSSLLKRLLRG